VYQLLQTRPAASEQELEDLQTTFNHSGASNKFKDILKFVLASACKLSKEVQEMPDTSERAETQYEKNEKKRKRVLDAVIKNLILVVDQQFRQYDKTQIIEMDTYIINKILKLSVTEEVHFQTFDKVLEDISFIPDI